MTDTGNVPVTVAAATPPHLSQRGLVARAASLLHHKSFWALADQGVCSVSNFATLILVGRTFKPETLGGFSLLWELMMFLNSLHAALIVYPLSVRGAKLDADRIRHFVTLCMIFTLALTAPFGATMFGVGAWQHLSIGLAAAGAIIAFQLHETLRRSLMSHFRYSEVIWGDAVGFLGSAGVVYVMAHYGHLSVMTVFAAMTVMYLLAAGVQATRVRPMRVQVQELPTATGEFWVLGRWMLASNLTALVTGVGVQWCLAAFQDLAQVGKFQAIANLLRLTNPVIAAMTGLIVPAVARAPDARAGKRIAFKYAAFGSLLLLPFFSLMFIAPGFGVALFYKKSSEYAAYPLQVRISVATAAAGYATAMILATLAGLGRSKANFMAQVVNTAASVLFVLPAAAIGGWTAAMAAGLFSMILTGISGLILFRRPSRGSAPAANPQAKPTSDDRPASPSASS